MVAGSVLPIAFHKNKLYFLFGKENPMEDSSPGFSDFGGGVEKNETPYKTALRECAEEISGFFGDAKSVEKMIRKGGGFYRFSHNDYHIHMVLVDYDENLPIYYNQNHRFLWERMDKTFLNDSKLFEKIEIGWFSIEDMKHRKKEFRGFYQEIIDHMLKDLPKIIKFAKGKYIMKKNKQNRTKQNRTKQNRTKQNRTKRQGSLYKRRTLKKR